MRTIAHISDLHFGAESAVLADALRKQLLARPPSLLVISGDLTQRARRRQYQAARAYLDTLPIPQIVVPGNHDIPLYDVVRRFFFPLRRYRHYLSRDVSPVFEDEEIFVAGINTARSLTWKSGRISPDQIEALKKRLNATRAPVRIVVTHHPFIPPPAGSHEARIDLVGRAVEALQVLEEQHVDLLLAGHLHHGYSGDTRTYYPTTRRSILSIQAGTAISRRVRPSDRNGFNLITLDGNSARVEVQSWVKDEFISLPIYVFTVDAGQRTRIDLKSSDNKAQFDVQDGTEDETGSTFYENQTKLDKIFKFEEFTIEVRGTAGATFSLSVKVGN